MITTEQTVSWEFGGWLAGQPAGVAWTILAAAAVTGAGLVWWSYRGSLVELSRGHRLTLAGLRLAVGLGLLAILAAPTRIDRHYEQRQAKPLAVLVDRSGSMTTPDNRSRRRLDDALARWRALVPAAQGTFGGLKSFAFADTLEAVPAVDSSAGLNADQTRLFQAMQRVLAAAPNGGWGGLVVLTDGLDTSGDAPRAGIEATARAALAGGVPLYFVPGRNRYAGGPYFLLREFSAPGQVPPRSTFRVEATFDSFQGTPRDVSVNLKVDGVARPATALHIAAGRRLAAWSAELKADVPGQIELELQAGAELARTTVKVGLPPTNRILYFQGALDWSYRFLEDIVKRDTAFAVTPVFDLPNPNAPLPRGALARLPATETELAAFDLVILANAVAPQLAPAQLAALDHWVRDGGVLLFLTPDDDSTGGFAGSELEKMLPVVFAEPARDGRMANLLGALRTSGGSGGGADANKLRAFAWEAGPQVREIFAQATHDGAELPQPLFSNFAHVAGAKPGAVVLARHPVETAPGSSEHAILLAVQRYGRGRSAVLTTDSLWRWKLHQPSAERGAELFWQDLFGWLTRDRRRGLEFDHAPLHAPVGRDVALRIAGAGTEKLTVEAVLGSRRVRLDEGTADQETRVFHWRPAAEGYWRVTASDPGGQQAGHWLSIDPSARTGEYSGQPPDEELLHTLANRTGGAVLEGGAPGAWQEERATTGELLAQQKTPLWHHRWVLAGLLGIYGLELLLRRRWKML